MSTVMDEPKATTKALKPAHYLFIDAYILNKNATKAAIAAGYSVDAASQTGWRLLKDERIQNEIKRRIEGEKERIAARQDRKERLAFSKDDFINESLTLYKEVQEPRDKARFLELAGKAQGYLNSDVNVNLNLGLFQNAAQELSSITNEHSAIKAELAPPASELKQVEHIDSHSDKSADVK